MGALPRTMITVTSVRLCEFIPGLPQARVGGVYMHIRVYRWMDGWLDGRTDDGMPMRWTAECRCDGRRNADAGSQKSRDGTTIDDQRRLAPRFSSACTFRSLRVNEHAVQDSPTCQDVGEANSMTASRTILMWSIIQVNSMAIEVRSAIHVAT